MSNNIKLEALSIDSNIQSIQNMLYNTLINTWADNLDGYGRIYKNLDKNNKIQPEFYTGKGENLEVYHNDNRAGTFFFIDDDDHKTEDGEVFTTEVKIVFMVNLKKIFPTDEERSDVKAQKNVLNILQEISHLSFKIKNIQKGIKNIFRGLDHSQIKFEDISPNHCFAVLIDLSYYIDNEC